ncbi:MAG: glycosyltransferase family 4 protein [Pseudomonadota bacterium]|nr:glycosyltransferase family 4 protein [Pseudomonadota bacterium]
MHKPLIDAARPRVLLSCSAGPVDHPATWSGTPHNLLHALQKDGQLVPEVRLLGESRAVSLASRIDNRLGWAHPSVRGPGYRIAQGLRVQTAAQAADCRATLHFGSYDLPWTGQRMPAYLYIDTSLELWIRQAVAAQGLSSAQRRWFHRFERHALTRAEHIFTVGQHVAANVIEQFGVAPERVTAIGTGRGTIRPYNGPKDYAAGRLLTVAKVRPHDKGLPLLLDAFAIARQTRPELTLTVVGGAKFPGIENHPGVRGTGWIEAEELQQIYEQSTLFVMPAMYEPWGLAYIEALACRTPVMGFNRNALPEISDHGRFGFLTDQLDAAGFATALLDALLQPERLAQMGAAGQVDCLRRYSWEQTAGALAGRICADLQQRASQRRERSAQA